MKLPHTKIKNQKIQARNEGSAIKVYIRIKPKQILPIYHSPTQISVPNKSLLLTFDGVFSEHATQQQVYEEAVLPCVKSFQDGFSSAVLAYGQTGSGKTYTMDEEESRGMISRTLETIFQSKETNTIIELRMVEIYCERVRDLLGTEDDLKVCDDQRGGTEIQNVTSVRLESMSQAEQLLKLGRHNRTTGHTSMNDKSSRSHLLAEIRQLTHLREAPCSRLILADLAGSERVDMSKTDFQTFRESKKINLSLSCLNKLIGELSRKGGGTGGSTHYSYRDSKLTRCLQGCLGGSGPTHLICTISTEPEHLQETLSTLRFGRQASLIVNRSEKIVQNGGKFEKLRNLFTDVVSYVSALERLLAVVKVPVSPSVSKARANLFMTETHAQETQGLVRRIDDPHGLVRRIDDPHGLVGRIDDPLSILKTELSQYSIDGSVFRRKKRSASLPSKPFPSECATSLSPMSPWDEQKEVMMSPQDSAMSPLLKLLGSSPSAERDGRRVFEISNFEKETETASSRRDTTDDHLITDSPLMMKTGSGRDVPVLWKPSSSIGVSFIDNTTSGSFSPERYQLTDLSHRGSDPFSTVNKNQSANHAKQSANQFKTALQDQLESTSMGSTTPGNLKSNEVDLLYEQILKDSEPTTPFIRTVIRGLLVRISDLSYQLEDVENKLAKAQTQILLKDERLKILTKSLVCQREQYTILLNHYTNVLLKENADPNRRKVHTKNNGSSWWRKASDMKSEIECLQRNHKL